MNEHLRPVESSSIDEGLRTRLEGDIELLEDALPLLESLTRAFQREEPDADDLATFRECIGQLPAIDEALDQVNRHEQATALTRAVSEKKRAAFEAGNARLVQLQRGPQQSLKAVTELVLAGSLRLGRRPAEGELRLGGSAGYRFDLAAWTAFFSAMVSMRIIPLPLVPVAAFAAALAALFLLPRQPWELLPDRLYLPPVGGKPARQRSLQDLREAHQSERILSLRFDDEVLRLRIPDDGVTTGLVYMLMSAELGPLQSPARPYVVLDGFDDEARLKGKVLVAGEGVLFVPDVRAGMVMEIFGEGKVPIDRVLELLAHLPPGRAQAVGAMLAEKTGASWMARGEVTVERSELDTVHAVLVGAGKRVRVKMGALGKAGEALDAGKVLAKLG